MKENFKTNLELRISKVNDLSVNPIWNTKNFGRNMNSSRTNGDTYKIIIHGHKTGFQAPICFFFQNFRIVTQAGVWGKY